MPLTTLYGTFSTVLLVTSMAIQARGADIYVPDDYASIQSAIGAAQAGDTVMVRPGTYYEWIEFLGKAITVKSTHGPLVTTIRPYDPSYGKAVVRFDGGENRDSVLDGFTITGGGIGEFWYHMLQGGGIFCLSAPTIVNNIIRDNGYPPPGYFWPQIGGGIFVWGDPLIAGNVITGNRAEEGGGIYVEGGEPILKNNLIAWNQATYYDGGGALLSGSSTFTGNVIMGNEAANRGGGLFLYTTSSWVGTNNTIVRNRAVTAGGGVCYGYSYGISMANSIVRGNTAPSGPQILGNPLTARHCNIEGGWSLGTGNIDADPLFFDPAHGDLHLRYDSPCRNAGTSSVPGLPTRDFEGDPRIADGEVDIGADEFHPHLYFRRGYLSGPGYLDDREIDVRVVGQPGTPDVTLAASRQIFDPPLLTSFGDLYLQPPLLTALPLGPIPANGVLAFTTSYPSSWIEGERYHFQALIGPSAAGSLLTNLMTLTVAPAPEPVPMPRR